MLLAYLGVRICLATSTQMELEQGEFIYMKLSVCVPLCAIIFTNAPVLELFLPLYNFALCSPWISFPTTPSALPVVRLLNLLFD